MSSSGGSDFKMLKALYDFTATLSQTLSFEANELFIFHSSNNVKKNWWSVINNNGKHGYIPSNYVTIIHVSKEEYLAFIYVLIEKLGKEIARDGGGSEKNLELMQELLSTRQSLEISNKTTQIRRKEKHTSSKSLPVTSPTEMQSKKEDSSKILSPPPPRLTESETQFPTDCLAKGDGYSYTTSVDSTGMNVDVQSLNSVSAVHSSDIELYSDEMSLIERNDENLLDCASVSSDAVYSLVQQVREATGLSFDSSKVAVGVVCEGLSQCHGVVSVMQSVLEALRSPMVQPAHRLKNTPDAVILDTALSHLASCHDDAQQRSWQLWDDEHTIKSNLELAINVLENADPEIGKLILKSNKYDKINMLLEYYQMEERWTIRELLISAFTTMSALDSTVISVLLNSVLPMELSREMEANLKSIERVKKLAKLLTIIFSTGEPMPITHVDHLGCDFVQLVLNLIESTSNEDDSEISDIMLTLILSYNLQFKRSSLTNLVVQSVSQVDTVKIFTEKLLLLLNREEDPVQRLNVHSCPCHSVLKIFMDIFSGETTAKLFYTLDIRVLVDIVTRQLTDLSPQSEKRTEYLSLCKLLLICCEDICYEHRLSELSSILTHILTEEVPPYEPDRKIVRDIFSALPDIFGFILDGYSG